MHSDYRCPINFLIFGLDISNQNDYSSMNKSDLVNAYLFDELSENDTKIKSTLDEILNNKNLSVSNKIMANLLLLKYQILQKNKNKVTKQT